MIKAGETLFDKYEIMMLTETFVCSQAAITLREHKVFHGLAKAQSRGRPQGGVAIAVRTSTWAELLHSSPTTVAVEIPEYYLIVSYYPPHMEVEEIVEELAESIGKCTNDSKHVICAGDYNCDISKDSNRTNAFRAGIEDLGLRIENDAGTPTYYCHNGSSTIDLVMTSMKGRPRENLGLTASKSADRKHCNVEFTITTRLEARGQPQGGLRRGADHEKLSRLLQEDAKGDQPGDVNEMEQRLRRAITEAAGTASDRVIKNKHKPWFDAECRELKFRICQGGNSPDVEAALRKEYKRGNEQKRRNYEQAKLQEKVRESRRKPWIMLPRRPQVPNPLINNDQWIRHFKELLSRQCRLPSVEAGDDSDWRMFEEEEVREALMGKPNKKAPGPDGITYEHLKAAPEEVVPTLTRLFNECAKTGKIPEMWKRSTIVPLYKGKGDATDPNNYRGITLACNAYKVLTRLVANRLLEKCGELIPKEQYGFIQGRSAEMAITEMIAAIEEVRFQGKVYAAFIDFRKAFDTVRRDALMGILKDNFNIGGKMLNLIRDILECNYIRVKSGHLSAQEEVEQTIGVAQGDSASPLLFVLYVAGLATMLRQTTARFYFYADDLVVLGKSRNHLQHYLKEIAEWCKHSGIEVNTSKTKIMRFAKGGRYAKEDKDLRMNNQRLEVVSAFTYLGVTVTPALCFARHIAERRAKTAAAMGLMMGSLREVDIRTAMNIFRLKISPMITYGLKPIAPYLTYRNLLEIDRVKAAFLKKTLGMPRNSSATLAHEMAKEYTFIEELVANRFPIQADVLKRYRDYREERNMNFVSESFTEGPAFNGDKWRRSAQRNRGLVCTFTWHGFHQRVCAREQECYKPENCICKICGQLNVQRYHIMTCKGLTSDSLESKVEEAQTFE